MRNLEIAKILKRIGDILELKGVEFKPRAYQKAALVLEGLSEDVGKIYQAKGLKGLRELPGIGESIARKIEEFLKTGKIKDYLQLKKKIPVNLEELSGVPGLGPKKIKLLYKKLKIKNLKDLERAIKQKKVQRIKTLGETTEEGMAKGVEFVKKKTGRLLLGQAYPIASEIKNYLLGVKGVKRVEVAGSFRRGKETVGDLDILVIAKDGKVVDEFVRMPDVKRVTAKGGTRAAVVLRNGLGVDLRVLEEKAFGSALLYFTGDKQHNIELRKLAIKKGLKLSEYGLFKGKKWIAGRTEEEIYRRLGMQYIEPEMRTNTGEIKLALAKKLPKLVKRKDITGDLQMHSTWSDGANSIKEMAAMAGKMGLKVIAITDHISKMGIAHGLEGKRFEKYLKEIERVNRSGKVRVLKGAEIDINKKGELLASPEMLKKLDLVIGAMHMGFKGSQTERVCQAMENYPINILAHPTCRKIGEREEISLDLKKVFETAKKNNVFLEINGSPERMDLKDTYVRKAKEMGCKFSLGSDAHAAGQMNDVWYSLINAQRAGLEKKDVLNCWNLKDIKKAIKK